MAATEFDSLQTIVPDVSRETFDRLKQLEQVFERWARQISLSSSRDLANIWRRHILDSAQVWALRDDKATRWIDLGSGSGFPGLVIACFLCDSGGSITLVESVAKKVSFLRNVAAQLRLPVTVQQKRVETLDAHADVVTARAFAPLNRLFEWGNSIIERSGYALLHKGRDFQTEIDAARRQWRFDVIVHPSKIERDGVILQVSNLRRAEK